MRLPSAKNLFLLLVVLASVPAEASFGGAPCNRDFGCHFVTWGVLIGVIVGIPLSCVAFVVLHLVFCHPERPKLTQAVLGGVAGIAAYEFAAVCGALAGWSGLDPMAGLAPGWLVVAIGAVLRVRSSPA